MRSPPQWADAMRRAASLCMARPLVGRAAGAGLVATPGLAQAKTRGRAALRSPPRGRSWPARRSASASAAPRPARGSPSPGPTIRPTGRSWWCRSARAGMASLPMPGLAGAYELRLTADRDGAPAILLRQPLAATEPSATVAAPARVRRGASFAARGIGPNGERDRVVLVASGAALDAPARTSTRMRMSRRRWKHPTSPAPTSCATSWTRR